MVRSSTSWNTDSAERWDSPAQSIYPEEGDVRGVLRGAVLAAALLPATAHAGTGPDQKTADHRLSKVQHFVVIYQENHSFDNLYGRWPGVDGLSRAGRGHTRQVDQQGRPYSCLLQNDVNLTSPPLPATCHDATHGFDSAF